MMIWCPKCGAVFKIHEDKDLVKCIRCKTLLKIVRKNNDIEVIEVT